MQNSKLEAGSYVSLCVHMYMLESYLSPLKLNLAFFPPAPIRQRLIADT